MKLQVLQEDFSKALSVAMRFSINKAQLPVLGNVLLSTRKNKLLVASTNLEVSVSISIGAKIEKEGEITVPARTLSEIISNLGKGQVDLEGENENLKISSNGFNSTLAGMNSSDFPKIPEAIDGEIIEIDPSKFRNALERTIFSVSIDETRPVLTGVLFNIAAQKPKESILNLVATDGYRLSWNKINLGKASKECKLIIPKEVLNEVLKAEAENILFSFKETESQVLFGFGNTVLSSRIIDGEFPDFEKIIPKEQSLKMNVDTSDFKRGVKLASVFAKDSANVIKMTIKKNNFSINAESHQSGSQETTVSAKVEGEGIDISFNYRFVEEFLNLAKGEDVEVELNSSNSPGVFKDPKEKDFLHLIMPVKMQS